MEKQLENGRKLVNKIIKNIGRNDLDWTIQISINSTRPDRINYACQIEAPAQGLQPITWVYDNWKDLEKNLKIAEENLNPKEIEKAWHEAEIARADSLKKYHEEAIEEMKKVEES